MVVLNEGEFDKLFSLVSGKNYFENDPNWTEIVKYKTALRSLAARKIANEMIMQKRADNIDEFIDNLFNLDFCATQVIDEIDCDFPPNMIPIFDTLEKCAKKPTLKNLENYKENIMQRIISNPATLYYKKFTGDLYQQIRIKYLVGKDFNRQVQEEAIRDALKENEGIELFAQNTEIYFSGIREEITKELLENHFNGLENWRWLFSAAENNRELVMKKIVKAEIEWCGEFCT
ncbi:MAG: hypothetical protein AABX39_03475 [Nanoarchaeota archaeon]